MIQSPNAATPPTTYTTIPISTADVISRSLQNLSSAVSRHRPWPELIASGSFTRPDSFPSALTRIRSNFHHFLINYSIVLTAVAAISLIGSPITLLLFASVSALWLLLHVFREDPLVAWGRHVSDKLVFIGLFAVTFLAIWVSGGVGNLVLGIWVGVLVCGVHAVLREPEQDHGSVADVENGASRALIGSNPPGPYYGSVSEFINK